MPTAVNEKVSEQMSRMPSKNTKPEIALRQELHKLGLRYRIHVRKIPGTPDIVFQKAKIAVFVDGCFWHSCPKHGKMPKSNRGWWRKKLEENVKRDKRNDLELESMGWLTVRTWEHEDPVKTARMIRGLWELRTCAQ